MPALLDKRLVIVTGKGGTGKSTVAAALALAAVRAGKRTAVVEVGGQGRVAELLGSGGRDKPGAERELRPGLFALSVDPDQALDEYLRLQVSGAVATVLTHNRAFEVLAEAAPGLRELVTIGKVWEMAQPDRRVKGGLPYDLVVLDAPATGHGIALLRSPRTFAEAARVGPIRRQAERVEAFVRDARATGVVAVALAEEMPVNETGELARALARELKMALDLVVANAIMPERFSAEEERRLEAAAASDGKPGDGARAAIETALVQSRRARAQRAELRRLRDLAANAPGRPPVAPLPFVSEPELGREEVEKLSRELERRLAA